MEGTAVYPDSDLHPPGAISETGGQKTKRGLFLKGDSVSVGVGAAPKKILADITNMDQQLQPKHQPTTDVSIDLILKENATMRKLLVQRNKLIESYKVEYQKYQTNFQKLRRQNSEFALANTQMTREINSSRQMVRELQQELVMKNVTLDTLRLKLMENDHKGKLNIDIDADESDLKFREDNKGKAKRKRVSRCQSSAPDVVKQVKSIEKVDTQRDSARRKSAGLKAGKLGSTEDSHETKYDASQPLENLANENESTSLGSNDVVRQDTESLGPTNTQQVLAKRNTENKRHSSRRQSALFKHVNPEPAEDFFDIDDPKFEVSNLCDNLSESLPTVSSRTSENCPLDPHERRSSIGRPSRRSALKVVSYKEAPINVKMRRDN
ncbi:shugoshin-1-like [Vicia villosa]|uniref:shugoshin-1-like n=1 Tax=Vicia villosa TaxID=3911 RepID=UPI00273AE8F9|nr:shugoshin-1-like [Vicia villosa]